MLNSITNFWNTSNAPPARSPDEQDIFISSLTIYPIKSCMGVSVLHATVTAMGLDLDRNWMIVDLQKNKQMSARDNRGIKLVRVKVDIYEDPSAPFQGTLGVSFPDDSLVPSFRVPLRPSADDVARWDIIKGFDLWGSDLDGVVVPALDPFDPESPDPSDTLSEYLGHPVKLVMRPPTQIRWINGTGISAEQLLYEGGVRASFADFYPLMIASTASLKDAQQHIEKAQSNGDVEWDTSKPLSITRFRPNIVVDGVETPFGEDAWQAGEVGEGRIPMIFPGRTPRCMFPNVDPLSGIRHPHVPHKVMMAYRRVEKSDALKNKYCFGVYGVPASEGAVLQVGDRIRVTDFRAI